MSIAQLATQPAATQAGPPCGNPTTEANSHKPVLALVLSPHHWSDGGGIALYLRDLTAALDGHARITDLHFLQPESAADRFALPAPTGMQSHTARGRLRYALRARRLALRLKPGLVIVGHLHLMPLARYIAPRNSKVIALAYGFEAWRPHRRLLARGLTRADCVFAISRTTRQRLLQWAPLGPERVRILPNAIPPSTELDAALVEAKRQKWGLDGHRVLLTLGRLCADEAYKGQDRVIELLPALLDRYPNLVFVIAGDGDDRGRLEVLAHRLGVQHAVRFLTAVDETAKSALFHIAQAFCMPSTGEGFGFVFLEALAHGLPVLAGSTDGSRDALGDGEFGLLVDPADRSSLQAGLESLLERPRSRPSALSRYGSDVFRSHLHDLLDFEWRAEVRGA